MSKNCNTSLNVPGFENCCELVYTNCILFSGPQLSCIPIETYHPTLTDVIMGIDSKLCDLASDFGSFDYQCLSYLQISSQKQFVEQTAKLFCQILGTQRPDVDITSLSQLNQQIRDLNAPPVQTCIRQLAPALPSSPTLHQLLTTLQDLICQTGNRQDVFVKVSENDNTAGYLYEQIDVDPGLVKTIVNPGGNERVKISIDYVQLLTQIRDNTTLRNLFCSIVDLCPRPSCIELNYGE